MFCLQKFKQLTFADQISELNNLPNSEPSKLLELLSNHFDIETFIPQSFNDKYYADTGRPRDYTLPSILSVLLLMHYFNFASTSNFCVLLDLSPQVRDFCNLPFNRIPDESVLSRFKTNFDKEIMELFNSIACHVITLFEDINNSLPDDSSYKDLNQILIYDTSGLKPKVTENNPKTLTSEINKQKIYAKSKNLKNFNPYAVAYKQMPKTASCNESIKLDYLNGHFGYFYKFGLLTNGFGIPLKITFFDDDFYDNLPHDFESPSEQKYCHDNASLKPVIEPFMNTIGNGKFSTFLGDSEFDSFDNFGLLKSLGFSKVIIPINGRNSKNSDSNGFDRDSNGAPICPHDKTPFIPQGKCQGKNRSLRYKYICPKSTRIDGALVSTCDDKCRETNSTVTTYTYADEDFRVYPGIQRGSIEYTKLYKIRATIERSISSLKKNPIIESPKTTDCRTMRSDLVLNAMTKLITVILANSINKPDYLKSIHKLIRNVA